jgi:acyl-coenzyme A thioesterase PaaI-like protein
VTSSQVRFLINLWPPLLCSGIRVVRIGHDWRSAESQLRLHWWNRNAVNSMFGGSLFAMTDALYPVMLQHNLGPKYIVWGRSANIEFLAPGRKIARARFELTSDRINQILQATADGRRHEPVFEVLVTDENEKAIARVVHTLYIRRKRSNS